MPDSNIPVKNIYYMLSYAWSDLQLQEYDDLSQESFDNAYDMFATILAECISTQLKRGLYRRYVSYSEDLVSIRGHINLPGTIRQKLNRRQRIVCDYDELSEDNLLNQIIKATALLLLRTDEVKRKGKNRLRRELLYFSNVSPVRLTDVKWNNIRYDRNNGSYRLLINICHLVVDNQLMSDQPGKVRLQNFTDGRAMSHLYEKFVLNYYKREFSSVLTAKASRIKWDIQSVKPGHMPIMQSDIMLTSKHNSNHVLIIDTKYYDHAMRERYDKMSYVSGNLYQIFTYTKNKQYELGNNGQVGGMLLYAKTNDDIQPDDDFIVHGSRLRVKTLDLNQPFDIIAGQLKAIADEFLELTGGPLPNRQSL